MSSRLSLIALAAVAALFSIAPAAHAARSGIVHLVSTEEYDVPEEGQPDFPDSGVVEHVYFNRDGTGWRVRSRGNDFVNEMTADERGLRTRLRHASGEVESAWTPASKLEKNYLRRPMSRVVVDPLALEREGVLHRVGETVINGRAAIELAHVRPSGLDLRYFVAKDDGTPLRQTHRARLAMYDPATHDDRNLPEAPWRTIAMDLTVSEVLSPTRAHLARLRPALRARRR